MNNKDNDSSKAACGNTDVDCTLSCVPNDPPRAKEDPKVKKLAGEIADELEADVLLYVGSLQRGNEVEVMNLVNARARRKNVFLMMSTPGGQADVAYLIAKYLQCKYAKITFFVSGFCKSAGTLVAIGAHELIFSPYGELGPLDVQLRKKDELGGQESGWALLSGVISLTEVALDSWTKIFLRVYEIGTGQITVQTAATIAANLTTGLFSPIFGQINPAYLGEVERALTIAREYGGMLNSVSMNLRPGGLSMLIEGYPSHGFVIDQNEANKIFYRTTCSQTQHEDLRDALGNTLDMKSAFREVPIIKFLSEYPSEQRMEEA